MYTETRILKVIIITFGILLLAVAAIIVLLPSGIEWGAENRLLSHYFDRVEIEDVDFNPFSGKLVIKGARGMKGDSEVLTVKRVVLKIYWWSLWKRRISFQRLSLEDAALQVIQQSGKPWSVAGIPFSSREKPVVRKDKKPWHWGLVALDLRNIRIKYRGPEVEKQFTVVQARLDPIRTWTPQRRSRFEVVLRTDQGLLEIAGEAKPFGGNPYLSADARIEKLEMNWAAPWLQRAGIGFFSGRLGGKVKIEAGFLDNKGLEALKIQGTISLNSLKMQVSMGSGPLNVQQEGFSLAGTYEYRQGGRFSALTDISAERLQVDSGSRTLNLLTMEKLTLKALRFEGLKRVQAHEVQIDVAKIFEQSAGLRAKEAGASHAFDVQSLRAEQVRLHDLHKLEMQHVALGGLSGWLDRGSQGRMELMKWFPGKAVSGSARSKRIQQKPWSLRIGKLEIARNSRVVFRDTSVAPPFVLTVFPFETQMGPLDTANPEQETPVKLRAKFGKYWGVRAVGTIRPFSQKPVMDLRGKFESIDLRKLAAYTAQRVGYRAKSGHLDADIKWRVKQGLLDAEAELVIDKLSVVRVTEGKEDAFDRIFGISLKTALSMLRDRNGRIVLRVPIQGNFHDPEFRLHLVVAKAVSNAMKKGAVSYFAPLGVTLLTGVVIPPGTTFVATQLLDLATTLRFKPVVFGPSSHALSPANKAYLKQMATRLKNRPGVKIVLCGLGTIADIEKREGITMSRSYSSDTERTKGDIHTRRSPDTGKTALTQKQRNHLLELAEQRAQAVKDFLVVQEGIGAGRLIICSPEVEDSKKTPPRVEMGI